MRRIALTFLMAVAVTAALAQPKETLTVDLPGDVATMDPHLQWDTESYTVYRNIFDNLVTRDAAGEIVPQVATAWRYTDDTTIVFDLRTDITFHDGSKLTPEDVAFSVRRIIDPRQGNSGKCGLNFAAPRSISTSRAWAWFRTAP